MNIDSQHIIVTKQILDHNFERRGHKLAISSPSQETFQNQVTGLVWGYHTIENVQRI